MPHNKFIGQILMMGIPSTELDTNSINLIKKYYIGNFIIFKRNTTAGKVKLRQLCDDLKNLCHDLDMPAPFIAVDQEGGRVQRLTLPDFKPIMANSDAFSINDVEIQAKTAHKTLSEIGININFAPVLDMNFENKDGVLKDRCYGKNTQELIDFGIHYIKALQNLGTMSVAKHFPGIGLVKKDPHDERPVVEASYNEIKSGILPFSNAINAGVFGIMTSHVIFNSIDMHPATFSRKISAEILREELGFNGILFSDDMEMGGISGYDKIEDATINAYLAGHDICLICHSLEKVEAVSIMLREECKTNSLLTDCIETSINRILSMKLGQLI
jgi:beta-N-acetylhexosaminidase